MTAEAKEQKAAMATAPVGNNPRTAAHVAGHLSFHRSIRAIRKRLRLSRHRGARGRWTVAAKEGFSRAQA